MSEIEDQLALQIKLAGLPAPMREYKAIPGRKFRWDFAWETDEVALLVEVQGGIWAKGGHTSGIGVTRDCEKLNLANILGWTTLSVTRKHIESGQALKWIEEVLR